MKNQFTGDWALSYHLTEPACCVSLLQHKVTFNGILKFLCSRLLFTWARFNSPIFHIVQEITATLYILCSIAEILCQQLFCWIWSQSASVSKAPSGQVCLLYGDNSRRLYDTPLIFKHRGHLQCHGKAKDKAIGSIRGKLLIWRLNGWLFSAIKGHIHVTVCSWAYLHCRILE